MRLNLIWRHTLLLTFSLVGITSFSQIKIGNNPTSINTNSVLELESSNKGLLLPRVALSSTASATPLSAHVSGMTVYNTATVGDVMPGFYYNNGTNWVKMASASDFSNLYTADGTLESDRIVDQGDYVLEFTGSGGNTLFTSGSVGIGITGPLHKLDVAGDIRLDGYLGLILNDGADASWRMNTIGYQLNIQNDLGGSFNNKLTITNSGAIGIGTSVPLAQLHTTGSVLFAGAGSPGVGKVLTSDATGLATWQTPASSGVSSNIYTADGTLAGNRIVTQGVNNLTFTGVGNIIKTGGAFVQGDFLDGDKFLLLGNSYSAKITHTENFTFSSYSGSQGSGANTGNFTWSNVNATNNGWQERMRLTASGNLGIGNSTPSEKLDVNGNVRFSGALMPNNLSGTSGQVLTSAGVGVAPTWTSLPSTSNLYTADGTLTGNRTVTQGANTLAFTSTATNGFSVDGTTFSVDAANNRVGIGTTNPAWDLDINNNNETAVARIKGAGTGVNYSLLSLDSPTSYWNLLHRRQGNGNMHQFTIEYSPNDASWYQYLSIDTTGKVGIGTDTPTQRLDVVGNVNFSGALMPNNLAGTSGQVLTSAGAGVAPTWTSLPSASNLYTVDGTLTGNRTVIQGANTLAFTSTATNGFSVDGTTFSVDAANNRIGIGNIAPTNTLHVRGTARIETMASGASTDGVVTVDATGVLKKRTVSSIVGNSAWSLLGNAGTDPNTNFIGTTDAQKFVIKTNNSRSLEFDVLGILSSSSTLDFGDVATNGSYTKQDFSIQDAATNFINLSRISGGSFTALKNGSGNLAMVRGLGVLSAEGFNSLGNTATINGLNVQADKRGQGNITNQYVISAVSADSWTSASGTVSNYALYQGTGLVGNNTEGTLIYSNLNGLDLQIRSTIAAGKGSVGNSNGAITRFSFTGSAPVDNYSGFNSTFGSNGVGLTVTSMYGFYTNGINTTTITGAGSVVTNAYGLFIGNINKGTTLNYGIYTSAGLNSFGDNIEQRGTGYLKLATGTTAQRPSTATAGMTRYNTTNSALEFNNGTIWNSVNSTQNLNLTTATSGTANSVLLLATGTFTPPTASTVSGRIYIIRNTSAATNVTVASVIDYGATSAASFTLTPAIGSVMIISDGTSWFRIQ